MGASDEQVRLTVKLGNSTREDGCSDLTTGCSGPYFWTSSSLG